MAGFGQGRLKKDESRQGNEKKVTEDMKNLNAKTNNALSGYGKRPGTGKVSKA